MKIRRIDFSPDEWLQGASRLDNATRGLYITACALIYSSGGPVDLDALRHATNDHGHAFNRQLAVLIGLGKLEETIGKPPTNARQITNKRCVNELQMARNRHLKAGQAAAKRWETKETDDTQASQLSNPSRARGRAGPSTIKESILDISSSQEVAARETRSVNGQATQHHPNRLARWRQIMTSYITERLPSDQAITLITDWLNQEPAAIARVNALNRERKRRKGGE